MAAPHELFDLTGMGVPVSSYGILLLPIADRRTAHDLRRGSVGGPGSGGACSISLHNMGQTKLVPSLTPPGPPLVHQIGYSVETYEPANILYVNDTGGEDEMTGMARFKVVQSVGWQHSFASPLFESDNEQVALEQASRFGDALGEAYEVVDSWNPANHLPASLKRY
jgi:hypothetical protein